MGKSKKEENPVHARTARPRRCVKKNHIFLESKKIPKKNHKRNNQGKKATKPDQLENVPPPIQRVPKEPTGNGRKSNFIRMRFQVDCSAATDVNVDELVRFLKNNIKVEGERGNLNEVDIGRRNSNINVMAKVILKKKYLKYLSKQFLKKKKLFNYHLIVKNKRAYKIVSKE